MSDDRLLVALRRAQQLGMIGSAPIEDAIEHARSFVTALGSPPAGARLIDLGSGGGLPGLVVANELPALSIVLLDRRRARTDHLERAVASCGWGHVEVWCAEAAAVVRSVRAGEIEPFDLVTARGFGPPAATLRTAVALTGPAGTIAISEPPAGDRWAPELLAELGLRAERRGPIRRFERLR